VNPLLLAFRTFKQLGVAFEPIDMVEVPVGEAMVNRLVGLLVPIPTLPIVPTPALGPMNNVGMVDMKPIAIELGVLLAKRLTLLTPEPITIDWSAAASMLDPAAKEYFPWAIAFLPIAIDDMPLLVD